MRIFRFSPFRFLHFISIALIITSCANTRYGTDSERSKFSSLEREHYTLTSDLVTEAEVQTYLGFIRNNNSKWNHKDGDFKGLGSGVSSFVDNYIPFVNTKNPAEVLALYKMIKENPEMDYFVNVRIVNENSRYLIYKKNYVKVKAKGVKLKTDIN